MAGLLNSSRQRLRRSQVQAGAVLRSVMLGAIRQNRTPQGRIF